MSQMCLLLGLHKNKNYSGPMTMNANNFIQNNIKHIKLLCALAYQYSTQIQKKFTMSSPGLDVCNF